MLYMRVTLAFAALAPATTPITRADGVPSETVHFEIDYVTVFGDSVFVLGDVPQLGAGDITRSIKLVPGVFTPGHLDWSVDIAIPVGTNFTCQYFVRDDTLSQWSNPANGSAIGGVLPGATAPANPANRELAVFVAAADTATDATFQTPSGPVTVPIAPVACRTDLRAARLALQPNGDGVEAVIQTTSIDTPLHRVYRKSGKIYNYVPDSAAVGTSSIETRVLPTTTVPATRTISGVTGRGYRVYLPRGYAAQTARRYPVLYMHDGQNVFAPGGPFGCWYAETVSDSLIKAAQVRELIIVAVDNSSQRAAEYVPELGNSTVTNADYNSFPINELKPVIDATYRTWPDRENTGVLGSSFGGIASLVLALDHSDVFGRVGAMSTSFSWGNTGNRVSSGEVPFSTRLYIDAGDTNDGGDGTIAVRDALLAGGRTLDGDLYFQIGYGQQHNEVAWNARLPECLKALFPITDESNDLERPLTRAGDIDGDGFVGNADLQAIIDGWGSTAGEWGYNPMADLDGDGVVSNGDLQDVLDYWAAGCP